MSVLVVGSANRDLMVPVRELPRPGETVPGRDPVWHFGGKGANQAVAAARCGAPVRFLAVLGTDAGGREYLAHLQQEDIDTSGIVQTSEATTGTAVIFVDDAARNMIVVSAGANALCLPSHVPALEQSLAECSVVVLQLEVPMETVAHVIREANRHGKRVILNPSPLHEGFQLTGLVVDDLILNEIELESLCGEPIHDEAGAIVAAERLRGQDIVNVIVTRGGGSTLLVTANGTTRIPTQPVNPVDTVGAGDTFAGAYAAAMIQGREPRDAVRFANAAAALSTLRIGAQESMPSKEQVEELLRH